MNGGSSPALLRQDGGLLYYIFPQVDWGFVFVDLPTGTAFTTALLGLLALGTPLSCKKTHLAEINTWLGFVIHPS